jgi:ketosteroid isomerase-like protein
MKTRAPGRAGRLRTTAAGRSPEDRLAVRAPPLYRWLCAALWLPVARLPPRSRVRRALIERTCARAYAAFNRRDLPVFLSMFDPEVVYDVSQVRDWPDQPLFKGLDGIREMALNWYASWEFSFELRELHDLGGDRCLLLSEFRMTGAGSGVPLDHVQWAQIGTARRGRWVRVENFTDRDDALRAAGLSR